MSTLKSSFVVRPVALTRCRCGDGLLRFGDAGSAGVAGVQLGLLQQSDEQLPLAGVVHLSREHRGVIQRSQLPVESSHQPGNSANCKDTIVTIYRHNLSQPLVMTVVNGSHWSLEY